MKLRYKGLNKITEHFGNPEMGDYKVAMNDLSHRLVYEGVSKSFRTESITKYVLTTINTRLEATQRVMAAKLTRLSHKKRDTIVPSGRKLYHLHFSLQVDSPETFGYAVLSS
jgi:hypothetical protein